MQRHRVSTRVQYAYIGMRIDVRTEMCADMYRDVCIDMRDNSYCFLGPGGYIVGLCSYDASYSFWPDGDIVMAYIVMAYIVMEPAILFGLAGIYLWSIYIIMACIVMAYVVA